MREEIAVDEHRARAVRDRDLGGSPVGKQSDRDNHANQLNPNNDAYWQSRGEDERPDDWQDREEEDDKRSAPRPPALRK